MEDPYTIVLVVLGLLSVLLLRSVGLAISARLRKRRANSTQARRHFVKAATMLGQVRTGKLSSSEGRFLAGRVVNEADLAFELDPKDAAVLILKSLALEHLGKPGAALKSLDAALSEGLTKSLTQQERGNTLTKRAELTLGQAKGKRDARIQVALADLQEAVVLTPKNPRAHLILGTCNERRGDKEGAFTAFQQALVLDPSYVDAKAALERLQGGIAPASVATAV